MSTTRKENMSQLVESLCSLTEIDCDTIKSELNYCEASSQGSSLSEGYEVLGSGAFGVCVKVPKTDGLVAKIYNTEDEGYTEYLRFIKEYKGQYFRYLPKIYKEIALHCGLKAVIMKEYKSQDNVISSRVHSWFEWRDQLPWASLKDIELKGFMLELFSFFGHNTFMENQQEFHGHPESHYYFDLHSGNIMDNDNGCKIFIDPLYKED